MKAGTALVTGCSSGIGLALVRELRSRGFRAIASARRAESLRELESEGLETVALDVVDPASVGKAVAQVIERAGQIDLLVNNAGVNIFGPTAEIPIEHVRSVLETNVIGALVTAQAVFPHMVRQGAGRIVNVGSVVGVLPTPFAGAYCASKAALHILSDVLRMEVAPFGIDVIVVQPGAVRSSIAESGSHGLERYAQEGSHYRAAYDGLVKRANASQQNPTEADVFARDVVDQITADPAPRLVRTGAGADTLIGFASLPGEQIDAMLSAQFGLDALKETRRS